MYQLRLKPNLWPDYRVGCRRALQKDRLPGLAILGYEGVDAFDEANIYKLKRVATSSFTIYGCLVLSHCQIRVEDGYFL
jgi:hypothetical protein